MEAKAISSQDRFVPIFKRHSLHILLTPEKGEITFRLTNDPLFAEVDENR